MPNGCGCSCSCFGQQILLVQTLHNLWPTRRLIHRLHAPPKHFLSHHHPWKVKKHHGQGLSISSIRSPRHITGPARTPSWTPGVAPIQLLHPSIASPDISAVTRPTLALPTFGVSTIPPSNDHPSDPTNDPHIDTKSTTDQHNFGWPRFGLLKTHFGQAHTGEACLWRHLWPNHQFLMSLPCPLKILFEHCTQCPGGEIGSHDRWHKHW